MYGLVERLFALDPQSLAKVGGVAGGQRGYTAFAVEHARDSRQPDLKEFFHVGRELPAYHRLAPIYPRNVWPDELPELRPAALALYEALDACATTLLEALAQDCGLPTESFVRMARAGNSILRAVHYPPVRGRGETGAIRAAPHEDINLITLLCEATDAGLEIVSDGEWLPVPAKPGEIVVDAGDMLSRVTNDEIPSTTHRVVNPPAGADRARYSLPFFVHPTPDCDLTVLERFVSPDRPARHPPTTAGAFLEERLREIGLDPA